VATKGDLIGGLYRLERPLGRGAMGSVWLARHERLDAEMAVKLINAEAARSVVVRSRFEREAKLVARVKSIHVTKMIDHGVSEDGTSYIVMEYLEGETLSARLRRDKRLDVLTTARLVSHVCRALTAAHAAGLVHRDLKPDNLFIIIEDGEPMLKVLDFGVAKATDLLMMSGIDPTKTGTLLGTPHYMSPEQARGLKSVDYRSDLWAVGVLIYECLTGTVPFTAPALGPLIAKVLQGAIVPPTQLAPDNVPAAVDGFMLKALCREPDGRFQSARTLSESFMVAAQAFDSLNRERTGSSPPAALATDLGTVVLDGPDTVVLDDGSKG
jgi:serine/threonine protein kinase